MKILHKLKVFAQDNGGNFAMLFGLSLFPLFGSIGLAVDYTRINRMRVELQNSLDASVLAAGRQFINTGSVSGLEAYASNFFQANFNNEVDISDVKFALATGASELANAGGESIGLQITATATTVYPLMFGGIFDVMDADLLATGSVIVNPNTIEVAFVFDASGSMTDQDGFNKSTKSAKDLLHNMKMYVDELQKATGTATEFIRYSLVPFAHSVNIGPGYQSDDTVMDTFGLSANHHRYLDWTQGYTASQVSGGWQDSSGWLTRWTLMANIGDKWMGCVEARPFPYFLDDTAPESLIADTLYVPIFAPDEADNFGGSEVGYSNNYAHDEIIKKNTSVAMDSTNSGTEALQAERIGWTSKYNSSAAVNNYAKNGMGPNRPCIDYPIYPLNGDFGQTNAQISHLNNTYAASKTIGIGDDDGATNIQQGIVWGWRTVSSQVPFTEGRDESDPHNKKVLIVITDGINSYNDNTTLLKSDYGAFGYASDSWMDEGITSPDTKTTRQKMDEHTLTTCQNAKAANVSIFVLGYGVTAGSAEEDMLASCSGGINGNNFYYSVSDAESVDAAFEDIRHQLIDMYLAG